MIVFRILSKFRQILSRQQKIRILELALLMVISGFMEMLSVTMILPFMEAVMDPEEAVNRPYVRKLMMILDLHGSKSVLIFLAFSLAILYIIKNAFLLFQMTAQNRFVYRHMFYTQQRLLRSYLTRPYEYFLSVHSGETLRIIGNDTADAFAILTQMISLFSELVVSATLLVTVFVIAPVLTVVVGLILMVLIVIIQRCTRPLIRRAGRTARASQADMNQWLLQAIQGIKEVKLMRRETYFEKRFEKAGDGYVKALYTNITWGAAPRFMIEATTMSVIFATIGIMIHHGAEMATLLPILSGIAMAAVRLLPAASRISTCMSYITYGEPAVDKLLENLKIIVDSQTEKPPLDPKRLIGSEKHMKDDLGEIELKDICYRYPTGSDSVLMHAGLTIKKGMAVGIVGASGAGKTTAVDVMLGLLRPQQGAVLVDGTDIRMDMDGWLSHIGYIPQAIFMLDGTIRENVAFGQEDVDEEQVWRALREAALDDYVRSLPEGLNTQIGERGVRLSGGQKQRIGIARALYNDPDILIFDEATSALDNDTEKAILDSIDHLHGVKTMVIIAHRLTTIENCDVIYRVREGRIEKVSS